MFDNAQFLQRIRDDYDFIQFSPRSKGRLFNTLNYIGSEIAIIFQGEEYSITYPTTNLSRHPVEGIYYPKEFAIIVNKNDQPVFVLACHFVNSGFLKNLNNSFEVLIGDCTNIQAAGISYGSILIFQTLCPVKNEQHEITGWDALSGEHLDRFIRLFNGPIAPHRPFSIAVCIIETPQAEENVRQAPLAGFDPLIIASVNADLNVNNTFIRLNQLRQNLEN